MVNPAETLFAEVAEIVATCCDPTGEVGTVKLPEVCPPPIVMLTGTLAAPLLELRFTSTPFAGAGFARVTVPEEEEPPVTVGGLRVRPEICPVEGGPGLMASAAETEFADVAAMCAVCGAPTGEVFTVKFALV